MSHDRLLQQYIRSRRSPDGQWHVDVPSGLTLIEKQVERSDTTNHAGESFVNFAVNQAKEIDAVCVTSQQTYKDVPRDKLNYDKEKYVGTGVFDAERVILVEAKTKSDQIQKGIGQLEAYATHFREYWDAENIEKLLVLLDVELDEYFQMVRDDLPVRLVDIPDANILK